MRQRIAICTAALLLALGAGYSIARATEPQIGYDGEPYTLNADKCGQQIAHLYQFWQADVAPTPNHQVTLETTLHLNTNTGLYETLGYLLNRETYYETLYC